MQIVRYEKGVTKGWGEAAALGVIDQVDVKKQSTGAKEKSRVGNSPKAQERSDEDEKEEDGWARGSSQKQSLAEQTRQVGTSTSSCGINRNRGKGLVERGEPVAKRREIHLLGS